MLKILPISLGCPKNRVDSERLLGSLGTLGIDLKIVDNLKESNLVFINTCGFIASAVEESIQSIVEQATEISALKGERPLLVVAGCLAGRFGAATLAPELPEVDLWLETKDLDKWAELLLLKLSANCKIFPPSGRILSNKSYAWLKINEGCGQQCSFCTIPQIRGKVQSSTKEFLVQESKDILAQGIKEIVLVAQDLTSWGMDLSKEDNLQSLLEALLPLDGLARLRLMYLYPAGLTDELLQFMSKAPKNLLPYFDIPLQHSHADILKRMGRPFANNPLKVIEKVRKYLPEAALRTSLIAGFPGETEAQFLDLCNFVQSVRFQNLGVFAYEQEEGTLAASMPNQIAEEVKLARQAEVMRLQAEISAEILEDYVGSEQEILIDAPQPEWPNLFIGRTWFQAPEVDGVTYVSGEGIEVGQTVKARIHESFDYDLAALVD